MPVRFSAAMFAVPFVFCLALAHGQETPPVPPPDESANAATAPQNAPDPSAATLPETVVEGQSGGGERGGNFPAEPLPDDTVISPTRTAQPLSRTASSVTVINQEQLQRYSQSTVAEVLRQTVGVDVVRSGGPGGSTSVFLRGANSNQTKVLLDGIPLNDPSDPSRRFDFNTLQVDNIERIEVLRGPQSTLYGSDAIGGVVNIITKRGQGPIQSKVSGQGGSFGTAQTGFASNGGNDKAYYSIGGSWMHTDGISAANSRAGNIERDQYKNGTISSRIGYNLNENWNADYVLRYSNVRAGIDRFDDNFPFLPVDQLNRFVDTRNFANRIQLSNTSFDGDVRQRIGFSLNDVYRSDTTPAAFDRPLFQGQTRQLDYQIDMNLTETNAFTAGAVYWHEDAAVGPSTFDPAERGYQSMPSAYLQDQFTIAENWTSTAGVRWDDNSRAGSAQTYRVGTIYVLPNLGMNFHGTLGTGFRAPALSENFFGVGGAGAFTNANLRPERSRGWDLGARKEFFDGKLWVDATYFRNDFQDLIIFAFDAGPPPGFRLVNVGSARSHGVELTSGWHLNDLWLLSGSYTHDDTYDSDAQRQLLRRPKDKGNVGITRLFPEQRAQVSAFVNAIGSRLDSDFSTADGLAVLNPYTTFNMTATWRPWDQVEFFARGDNLTNTIYEEVRGFGTPPISGYGGMNLYW